MGRIGWTTGRERTTQGNTKGETEKEKKVVSQFALLDTDG